MAKSILIVPEPRGYSPYAYKWEIEERAKCLVALLDFIQDEDLEAERYWAKLCPVLFNEELEDIGRKDRVEKEGLLSSLDRKQRSRLREEVKDLVGTFLALAEQDGSWGVRRAVLGFGPARLWDETEIIRTCPTAGFKATRKTIWRWLRRECAGLIWWSFGWLRFDALLFCQHCGRVFLRFTRQRIKYCCKRCLEGAFAKRWERKRRRKRRRKKGARRGR